jgi:hypothetical protein
MFQRTFIFIFFLSIFVSLALDPSYCLTAFSDLSECPAEQVGSDQLLQMYVRLLL